MDLSDCVRCSSGWTSIRIDHFRGFEAYWEVPAGSETAATGRWVPGPGRDFFEAIRKELGSTAR